ncbi:MAG: glycoside hydrolase family 3 protein [Elusimicrobiota bacterium]
MKKIIGLTALCSVLCLLGGWIFSSGDRELDKLVEGMSLEQKVGQLFMVGNFAKKTSFEEVFSQYYYGNVFLGFADINHLDAEQITALTARLQELSAKYNNGVPLLIATDQEGGKVNRVRNGVVTYPNEEFVGANLDLNQAEKLAEYTAQQLRAIGINVNFAPVVDVNTEKKSHIAKNGRAFSEKPDAVADFGIAYMKGFKKGGIIGCAKHFPGYGDVAPDPHRDLPVTKKTLDVLEKCELVPYKALIKSKNVDLIMTAHIMTPGVTGTENLPATISKEIMQKLLRDKMGFKGVIVTDDFNMGAMSAKKGADELAVQCLNAGVDIILFVGDATVQKKAWNGVLKAAGDGRIPEKRLNEAVRRVLALKKKYGLFENNHPSVEKKLYNTEEQKQFLTKLLSGK